MGIFLILNKLPFFKNYINYKINSILANPMGFAGGKLQIWKILEKKLSQHCIENKVPLNKGEDMVKRTHDVKQVYNVEKSNNDVLQIDESKLIFNQRIEPNKHETFEELMNEFLEWWTVTENHSIETGREHIKSLRRMKNHPIYPVNWFDLLHQIEQIINQLYYMDRFEYRESREQEDNPLYGRSQFDNFLKAIDVFGRANGIHGLRRTVSPYLHLKNIPKPRLPNMPTPPVINKLIHYRYSKDEVINAEIKTILAFGFHTGPRPSELTRMRVCYIDDRNCEAKKREDKVDNPENWVPIDKPVMHSHQQPSVKKNWIDLHRKRLIEKLSISEEEDEGWLFPDPRTGKRFKSSKTFYKWLCSYVKPVLKEVYPDDNYDFYPKIMRTWCGIATLIRTKVETGNWDIREVKYRLGHDDESNVTEDYVRCAKVLYKRHKYDWFRAVLKFHPTSKRMQRLMKKENGEDQKKDARKLTNDENTPSEPESTEEKGSAPVGI